MRFRPLPQSLTVVPEEMMCPNQQVAISEQLPLYRILNQVVSELRLCWFRFSEKREVGLRVFPPR